MSDTHVVTNQVPPLENYNPASSPVLIEALIQEGGQWGLDEVNEVGAISASCQAQRWGELADRNRPIRIPTTLTGTGSMRWSTTRPTTS
ncbi:acyl-CoA dehydrogenase [Mycobacterium tuberculosis]|nr:acyl-CoA dehydrogenase [Mycobacterium tuberculosis]